ncbi:unnamed protein product, partial [Adineta ricciae]
MDSSYLWWIILMGIGSTTAVSFYQPKFCPNVTWNTKATTFVGTNVIGTQLMSIFIDTNDNIYVSSTQYNQVIVWSKNSTTPTAYISGNLKQPCGLFVTTAGDIFVDNGFSYGRIERFSSNGTQYSPAMYISSYCNGLFIDANDTLYCSINQAHVVVKRSLNSNSSATSIAAGKSNNSGYALDKLYKPNGLFVDNDFNLYVADSGNARIQRFQLDQLNATTIVGNGSNQSVPLSYPTGIMFDADNNLYIADYHANRIIIFAAGGYRCLPSCSTTAGPGSTQLNAPSCMAFDRYGNMFVADQLNGRVQKFTLLTNSCDSTTLAPSTTQVITGSTTLTTSTTTSVSSQYISSTEDATTEPSRVSTTTTTTITSQIILSNQSCSPNVTIVPTASRLSSPLQVRRSQNFYFVSLITLGCSQLFSISTSWTITYCTSTCSKQVQINGTILTTYSDLYIPAQALSYGIYKFELTVTMVDMPSLQTTSSVYVHIIPSAVTANLIQYGTSMVTIGYNQDLLLDPGSFSVDLDESYFNATNWKYKYYCRIYGQYNFPNFQGSLITIDDPTVDPFNRPCLSNQTEWQFGNSIHSSVTILSHSLQSNRTYQFMVLMENRDNSSLQGIGYLLINVEDTPKQLIGVGCIIQTMCVPNMEFQLVNPSTQVALFSACLSNCSTIINITWNIYSGSMNSSSNVTQWTLFNQTNSYENIWFFGRNTSNFTSINQLFLMNPQVSLWRFEALYQFASESSSSALNFVINQPPSNGSCSIFPLAGTTDTLFTISCSNWFDEDGIKDYSLYFWAPEKVERSMVTFSVISTFQVRLPATSRNTSLTYLTISIRDEHDSIQEVNITSVTVTEDLSEINDLLNNKTSNSIVQLLSGSNQNTAGQILSSLSQQLNQLNLQNLDEAVSNQIPLSTISISQLDQQRTPQALSLSNSSAMNNFTKNLNSQANVREYLINFTETFPIFTSNSIAFQAFILSQLTEATNQLTRSSAITASNKCYQLANNLNAISTKITYEDVQISAEQITKCITNVLTAINGPLQGRTTALDLDYSRANDFPADYDTDLESAWSNPKLFADGDDFSWSTIEKNRNLYYQKQAQNQVSQQTNQSLAFLTSALNNHLNIGQNFTINASSVFMSLQVMSTESLSNQIIKPINNAQIQLPSIIQSNDRSVSLRSIVQPLAPADQSRSYTNLSRTISLSILDRNGNELSYPTSSNNPYRFVIPRDSNLILPSMVSQNVTSMNSIQQDLLFNLHYVDLSQSNGVSVSVHIEMKPLNPSLGYLLIYKFDSSPVLNSSMSQIDKWSLFCPSNLTSDNMYTYFINNQLTNNHESLIFGLRELNSTEMLQYCSTPSTNPPITNEPFHFTSNYELRLYTSGCYYLDSNNQWQSDGVIVGPLTNVNETECLSTHLTTFAGGFLVLPAPINWNYVFANADFNRNKTIYITVICVSILYLLIMTYARYKDRKDIEKLGVLALEDNCKEDQYCYQIIVFTGNRKNAGTKSRVHFILAGDEDETQVRTFNHSKRQIFQRGQVDSFVMTVPKSLGKLNYIRIWHNNQDNSSWFLKYLIVRDLQTLEKSYFIFQRWFAIDKDDGRIERLLPVSGKLQMDKFAYILSKQTYYNISEDHLWFSIFTRPPSNKFTRVQRCTCCFVLLLTSMLLNILYYDQKNDAKSSTGGKSSLSFGPLYITPEQIGIGIIVELLVFIPSLCLIQFFRRIQPSRTPVSPLRQTLSQIKSIPTISSDKPNTKKSFRLTFPWWCLFLAYGLSFTIAFVSVFFIIVRGIEFGDLKTQKWLTSLISGFFSSILLLEPVKICALTVFFACFIRTSDKDKQANEYLDDEAQFDLNNDEEYLQSTKQGRSSSFISRSQLQFSPLSEWELEFLREKRSREKKMQSIMREVLSYICFLVLLNVVIYSNQVDHQFEQVNHLRKYLVNLRGNEEISTIDEYWNWLETDFVEKIRAQDWYNGDPPQNLSGYFDDKTNRLIGW